MKHDERLINLEGAYNFRHAGGYKTQQGTFVKWGTIYRSGDLHELTQKDIERLELLKIKTIIDFRTKTEKDFCPDAGISTVRNRIELPINVGSMLNMQFFSALNDGREIMKEVNRLLVRYSIDVFSAFFEACSDEKNLPLLFHCSAGKDRTGTAAALFLSAVGVDKETIISDFCLSAAYVFGKPDLTTDNPVLAPIMTVTPDYLEAAFEVIDTEFGGMETYLKQWLKVDTDALKKIYTE